MRAKLTAVTFGAAVAVGSMMSLMLPATASAMTLQLSPLIGVTDSAGATGLVEKVGHRARRNRRRVNRRINRRRANRRHYRYQSRRHGPRYRYRRGRHKHYYNGYWYAVPFWLGAAAIANSYYDPYYDAAPVPEASGHVQWCLNRYRSYNPRTDTFRGYDGYNHRCRSPYHP